MLVVSKYSSAGIYNSLRGISLGDDKKKYYFKLLQNVFSGKYTLESVDKCVCGSTDLEVLSDHDRFTLPFGSVICRLCGLIQLSPRLSSSDLPNFYEEIYWGLILGGTSKELATGGKAEALMIYSFIEKYLGDMLSGKKLSVVEIGCGSGVKLDEIRRHFHKRGIECDVSGCDYSEDALIIARKKNINIFKGGIDSLSGQKADIVILSHVVEHFSDIYIELEKIKEILNPDAYVYIEVPGVCDLMNKREYGYDYITYSVMAHLYNFNLTSLRSIVESSEFEFIVGNEYVRSLFRYNPCHQHHVETCGNYEYTIQCLKYAEEKRARRSTLAMRLFDKAEYYFCKAFE